MKSISLGERIYAKVDGVPRPGYLLQRDVARWTCEVLLDGENERRVIKLQHLMHRSEVES